MLLGVDGHYSEKQVVQTENVGTKMNVQMWAQWLLDKQNLLKIT